MRLNIHNKKHLTLLARRPSMPGNLPKGTRKRIKAIKGTLTSTKRQTEVKKKLKNLSFEEFYNLIRENELKGTPLQVQGEISQIILKAAKKDSNYSWIYAFSPSGGYTIPAEKISGEVQRIALAKKDSLRRLKFLNEMREDLLKRLEVFDTITTKAYRLTALPDFAVVPHSSEQFRHTTIRLIRKMRDRTNSALYTVNKMRKSLGAK